MAEYRSIITPDKTIYVGIDLPKGVSLRIQGGTADPRQKGIQISTQDTRKLALELLDLADQRERDEQ